MNREAVEGLAQLVRGLLTDAGATPEQGARVSAMCGDWEFTATLRRAAPGRAGDLPSLPALERAVLQAATAEPQPAKVLARKAGRRLNSHFYEALRNLTGREPPLLIKVRDGFRLP